MRRMAKRIWSKFGARWRRRHEGWTGINKRLVKEWWYGRKGEWYVVIQLVLFALLVFGPAQPGGWSAWPPPWGTAGRIGGLLLGFLGGGLFLWGIVSLGDNLTAVPHPKESGALVQSGAYRLVRHPIYSGLIIGGFGYALLRNGWLTLLYALLLFLFFDVKSRREEKWLAEKFANYSAYQARVKKLLPFLY